MKQVSTIVCGGRERSFQVRSTADALDESNSCESTSSYQSEWDTYDPPGELQRSPVLYTNPNGKDYLVEIEKNDVFYNR